MQQLEARGGRRRARRAARRPPRGCRPRCRRRRRCARGRRRARAACSHGPRERGARVVDARRGTGARAPCGTRPRARARRRACTAAGRAASWVSRSPTRSRRRGRTPAGPRARGRRTRGRVVPGGQRAGGAVDLQVLDLADGHRRALRAARLAERQPPGVGASVSMGGRPWRSISASASCRSGSSVCPSTTTGLPPASRTCRRGGRAEMRARRGTRCADGRRRNVRTWSMSLPGRRAAKRPRACEGSRPP